MNYRLVQGCVCGCGKKRAIKSTGPILYPQEWHHEKPGADYRPFSFTSKLLEALGEPEPKAAVEAIMLEEIGVLRLRIAELEAKASRGFWGRLLNK